MKINTFDANNFKEPNKMISYLHNKKIKIGLTLNPTMGIRKYETHYATAMKYIKADRKGVIPFNVYDNVSLLKLGEIV